MRNSSIDVAKGIGIILVVLGHNWIINHDKGEVFRVIFSFHMPLFFFLSGIFLKPDDSPRKFLITKADSLLKPYFVVLCALGLKSIIASTLFQQNSDVDLSYFGGILYAGSETIPWVPLWFLPHLFLASGVTYILLRLTANSNWAVRAAMPASFLLVGTYHLTVFWHKAIPDTSTVIPGLPWSMDLILVTVPFIMAGQLLGTVARSIEFDAKYFFPVLVAFAGAHYLYNETIDFNQRSYGDTFISTAQAVMGIYLSMSVSNAITRIRRPQEILSYIGKGTLLILIFHSYFQDKIFLIALKELHWDEYWAALSGFLAGIITPLVILEITKKSKLLSKLLLPQKYKLTEKSNSPHAEKIA